MSPLLFTFCNLCSVYPLVYQHSRKSPSFRLESDFIGKQHRLINVRYYTSSSVMDYSLWERAFIKRCLVVHKGGISLPPVMTRLSCPASFRPCLYGVWSEHIGVFVLYSRPSSICWGRFYNWHGVGAAFVTFSLPPSLPLPPSLVWITWLNLTACL